MAHPSTFLRFAVLLSCLAMVAKSSAQEIKQGQGQDQVLTLKVGEQNTVSAEGVQSYSLGVPDIADVRVAGDGKRFVIVGRKPGSTSLLLLNRDGSQRRYTIAVPMPSEEGAIAPKDNIRLDLYFVELSEGAVLNLGLAWSTAPIRPTLKTTADFSWLKSPPGFTSAATSISAELIPRLDFLHSGGWARLIRHAVVVTANNANATFSSGGQYNLAVQGALAGELKSIDYGSQVSVTPRFDRNTGRIELTVNTEVSTLTETTGSSIPGKAHTSTTSTANLEPGESIVLGGLQAEHERVSKVGLPVLSQLPILGPLFGSYSRDSQRTENAILIVPTVMEPAPRLARERIERMLDIYATFRGTISPDQGAGLLERQPRLRQGPSRVRVR